MIAEAIVFVILTYITFAKYDSPALMIAWLFMSIGLVLTMLTDYSGPLLLVGLIGYILTLVMTVMVTRGANN